MLDTASALASASAQLLESLTGGQAPLTAVSASLEDLATELGVQRVIVAIDDAENGRQVFCSARAPLGELGELLFGPPRACTDPIVPIDDALGRLIVATVGAAFERARGAVMTPNDPARPNDLTRELDIAIDRCTRYGWGFTLVMLRFDRADVGAAREIASHMRVSDTLVQLGPREHAMILPAAGGDEVPGMLARVGRGGAVSTICYGLAVCPGEASDARAILALASSRLQDAETSRTETSSREPHTDPTPVAHEIHKLEGPLV